MLAPEERGRKLFCIAYCSNGWDRVLDNLRDPEQILQLVVLLLVLYGLWYLLRRCCSMLCRCCDKLDQGEPALVEVVLHRITAPAGFKALPDELIIKVELTSSSEAKEPKVSKSKPAPRRANFFSTVLDLFLQPSYEWDEHQHLRFTVEDLNTFREGGSLKLELETIKQNGDGSRGEEEGTMKPEAQSEAMEAIGHVQVTSKEMESLEAGKSLEKMIRRCRSGQATEADGYSIEFTIWCPKSPDGYSLVEEGMDADRSLSDQPERSTLTGHESSMLGKDQQHAVTSHEPETGGVPSHMVPGGEDWANQVGDNMPVQVGGDRPVAPAAASCSTNLSGQHKQPTPVISQDGFRQGRRPNQPWHAPPEPELKPPEWIKNLTPLPSVTQDNQTRQQSQPEPPQETQLTSKQDDKNESSHPIGVEGGVVTATNDKLANKAAVADSQPAAKPAANYVANTKAIFAGKAAAADSPPAGNKPKGRKPKTKKLSK